MKGHLKQPRPQLAIEHDIKAEDLKADALSSGRLSWSTHAVRVKDVWVGDDHCLDDDVGDGCPDLGHVVVGMVQVLVEVAQRPFTARHAGHILLIVLAVLVDGVVRQVHVQVILHSITTLYLSATSFP